MAKTQKKKHKKFSIAKISSVILMLVFIFSFGFCYFYLNNIQTNRMQTFNNTILKIKTDQQKYLNSVIKQQEQEKPTNTVLFTNGKTAVLSGFEKLNVLKNFNIEIKGTLKVEAGIKVDYNFYMITNKKNGIYSQFIYLYCHTIPTFNTGEFGCLENGIVKQQCTQNIYLLNDGVIGSDELLNNPIGETPLEEFRNTQGNAPGDLFYNINKRTVINDNGFYIKKNLQNEVEYYYTNFNLEPNLSTTKYVTFIKNKLHSGKDFNFKNITANIMLDNEGKIRCLNVVDSYTLVFPISFIETTVSAESKFSMIVSYE